MPNYSACGLAFQSALPFPELSPAVDRDPLFNLGVVRCLPAIDGMVETGRTLFPDGQLWLKRSRAGSRHLLQFDGFAAFLLDTDNHQILASPAPGMSRTALRHLFLNHVLPLYLSAREHIALHASAVALPGRAIAFMGDAGRGKSTLARSFVARGCALVTDDTLLLDRSSDTPAAVPSYPGLRLWPDAAEALGSDDFTLIKGGNTLRRRTSASQFTDAPVPLASIYLLSEPADSISIRPVPARHAVTALLRANFLLEADDPQRLTWQFRRVADLAARPLIYSLTYPRDYRILPQVCDAVLAHSSRHVQ